MLRLATAIFRFELELQIQTLTRSTCTYLDYGEIRCLRQVLTEIGLQMLRSRFNTMEYWKRLTCTPGTPR